MTYNGQWQFNPTRFPHFAEMQEFGSDLPFDQDVSESCPFVSLWVAVIAQAMMDAQTIGQAPITIYARREAIHWLTAYSKDFRIVCNNASLNPAYVHRLIVDFFNKRLPPGKPKFKHLRERNIHE